METKSVKLSSIEENKNLNLSAKEYVNKETLKDRVNKKIKELDDAKKDDRIGIIRRIKARRDPVFKKRVLECIYNRYKDEYGNVNLSDVAKYFAVPKQTMYGINSGINSSLKSIGEKTIIIISDTKAAMKKVTDARKAKEEKSKKKEESKEKEESKKKEESKEKESNKDALLGKALHPPHVTPTFRHMIPKLSENYESLTKEYVDRKINEISTRVNNLSNLSVEFNRFKHNMSGKINSLITKINEFDDSNNDEVFEKIKEVNEKADTDHARINNYEAKMDTKIKNFESEINDLKKNFDASIKSVLKSINTQIIAHDSLNCGVNDLKSLFDQVRHELTSKDNIIKSTRDNLHNLSNEFVTYKNKVEALEKYNKKIDKDRDDINGIINNFLEGATSDSLKQDEKIQRILDISMVHKEFITLLKERLENKESEVTKLKKEMKKIRKKIKE